MLPAGNIPYWSSPDLTDISLARISPQEESHGESKYAEMMEEWRRMINDSRKTIDEHFGR